MIDEQSITTPPANDGEEGKQQSRSPSEPHALQLTQR